MIRIDLMTLWGIAAALLVLANACAWTAFVVERRARRREESLERDILSLWDEVDDLRETIGWLACDIRANADDCDLDRNRIKKLEETSRLSPRQTMRQRMPAPVLALPAVPSVRDAIDPAWNGGTQTFDSLTAALGISATDTGTWLPKGPDVGRVQLAMPLRSDDTSRIPKIEDAVTGELVMPR